MQIFGDTHGNAVHLFERECSIQRRHQKIIEESPSPSVPARSAQSKLGEVSVRAAKSIRYEGAGTFEFIFDNKSPKTSIFMEMNTRLQVEHPITELVTGVDLVQEQIMVALGKPLSFKQEDIVQRGHAIEARICAEDPVTFAPSPGKDSPLPPCRRAHSSDVDNVRVPGLRSADFYYDPMIAKLIAVWSRIAQTCDSASCIAR